MGRTDGRTPYRYIDLAAYYARSVRNLTSDGFSRVPVTDWRPSAEMEKANQATYTLHVQRHAHMNSKQQTTWTTLMTTTKTQPTKLRVTTTHYWHCPHSMRRSETVLRPSVCLSVLFSRRTPLRRACCQGRSYVDARGGNSSLYDRRYSM